MNDHDDLGARLADLVEESAAPVTFAEVEARAGGARPADGRRRRAALVAACVVLVASAVALAAVARRDTATEPVGPAPSTAPTTAEADSTTTTEPGADPVASLPKLPASAVHDFALPPDLRVPHAVYAEGALWLAGSRSGCTQSCPAVYRLDPTTGSVAAVGTTAPAALDLAYDNGALWILSDEPNGSPYQVTRVDIANGRVAFTVPVPDTHVYGNTNPVGRIAAGLGSVWVYEGNDFIARLDPATGRQVARIQLPRNLAANGLAVNAQGLWVVAFGDTPVMHVDPSTNTAAVATRFSAGFAQSIAADADAGVWTTHFTSELDLVRINAIDASTTQSTHVPTPDVAVANGQVWFLGWEPGELAASPRNHYGLVGRINPKTLTVVGVAELAIGPGDETVLVAADHGAWVVDSTTSKAWFIDDH